jgi:prolipoprotein diacylglyceryltransferase
MHYPVEFVFGSARIPAHLVFEMLAYTLGYLLYVWQRKGSSDPISDENRWWIFIGAAAGALLGSHVLGVLERPDELKAFSLVYFLANKTVLGGFLGGLIGVELTKKVIGVTVSSGDLMTYPILLGLAIGRIGCHLAGLTDGTYGLPASQPWAIDFGDGMPRHPVNLYEIIYLGLLALVIYRLDHRSAGLADGDRFKIFMTGYLLWRFFAEWLKPVYFLPIGLTSIQLAALGSLLYYAWISRHRFMQKRL